MGAVWKRSSVIGAPHAPTCCTARRRRPETLLNFSSSSGFPTEDWSVKTTVLTYV